MRRILERYAERARAAQDPATPPERAAAILVEDFDGMPAPPGLVETLVAQGSADHARRVAAAAGELAPESVTTLTVQAEAARVLDGDRQRARELLERAMAADSGLESGALLAEHLRAAGMELRAFELLSSHIVEEPDDDDAHRLWAEMLQSIHCRAQAGEVLQPAEREALERFADRTLMYRLRDSLRELAEGDPDVDRRLSVAIRDWLAGAGSDWTAEPREQLGDGQPDDGRQDGAEGDAGQRREAMLRMAIERAWLRAGDSEDDDDTWDDDDLDQPEEWDEDADDEGEAPEEWDDWDDDEEDPDLDLEWERSTTPLALAARAATTSPALARAARDWYETFTYGLWLVADPSPSPGVWLTDILTGTRRYVAIAPEQLDGLRRWSVLLGPLVALQGIWRTTGAFVALRPAEGDRAAAYAKDAVRDLLSELTGGRARGPSKPARQAEPHGVLVEAAEPADPLYRTLATRMLCELAPTIIGGIWQERRAGPQLRNMEGHRVKLITASVVAQQPGELLARLADHPDFRREEDGELSWWGRELTADEQASMLASLRAQLGAEAEEIEQPDERPRWLRGRLRPKGDAIEVEVNSQERLEALLRLLHELGEKVRVTRRSAIDPSQDMVPPAATAPLSFGESADELSLWRQRWLSAPSPALDGLTPRAAAKRKRQRPRLEALMRTLEHDADELAAAGRPVPDLAAVRAELGIQARL